MKMSTWSLGLIFIVILAVAFSGCTSSSQTSGTAATPASTAEAAGSATTIAGSGASTGSGTAAGGTVTGSSIFGTPSYEWFEYKETTAAAGGMTIYYKYNIKTGECTMRYEGANLPSGMPTTIDCSNKGTTTTSTSNPNEVASDVKFTKVGTEVVTVPAGTFTADKYTATVNGNTATYWIVSGKPMIKMVSSSSEGSMTMELNGWG